MTYLGTITFRSERRYKSSSTKRWLLNSDSCPVHVDAGKRGRFSMAPNDSFLVLSGESVQLQPFAGETATIHAMRL